MATNFHHWCVCGHLAEHGNLAEFVPPGGVHQGRINHTNLETFHPHPLPQQTAMENREELHVTGKERILTLWFLEPQTEAIEIDFIVLRHVAN